MDALVYQQRPANLFAAELTIVSLIPPIFAIFHSAVGSHWRFIQFVCCIARQGMKSQGGKAVTLKTMKRKEDL